MNATQVQAPSSNKDRLAIQLFASFYKSGGSALPFAGRHCASVVKSCGSNPSYAMVGIPVKDSIGPGNWDKTPGLSLRTNFADKIKLLSRASCGYSEAGQSVTLLNGWVVSHGHNGYEDSIVTQLFDDRHIMASYYTCFGKMVFDPSQSGGKHYFLSNPSDPLVFNKWGHGDCLDTAFGPRFAPGHRFGHLGTNELDATDEPAVGDATSKTRKWTVKDILAYLRQFFYETKSRPSLGQDFGLLQLPIKYLEWPKELGNNIVENKTPQNFSLDGCNLLEAIVKTLAYAGPYELNLEPVSNLKSRLEVIDFSKRSNTGIRIFSPDYFNTLDDVANNPNVAEDHHIKQSCLGWVDNVVNTGDAPCIEFMASTDPADSDCVPLSLLPGWTEVEEAIFKLRTGQGMAGTADQGDGDATFFSFASKESPSVYAWYRLNPDKNPFDLSKHATMNQSGNFVIRPHQLTSYNNNASSPLGMIPREFVIEAKMTAFEYTKYVESLAPGAPNYGEWRTLTRLSELQLSPCGRYIQIPGLRDLIGNSYSAVVGTWLAEHIVYDESDPPVPSNAASQYGSQFFQKRHIRIQVVAESDHCLVSKRGTDADPNETARHIDSEAPKFSLLIRNERMQYVDFLRRTKSYPCGIGGLPTTIRIAQALLFQPLESQGHELFTDHIGDGDLTNPKNRLDTHCQKYVDNHKRIMWEGYFQIARITPVYRVGQIITYDAPEGLQGVTGIIKCIVITSHDQKTKIEIGPPEFSTIWDGPMQQFLGTGGTGAPPAAGATTPDKYNEKYDPSKGGTTTKTEGPKDDYDYGSGGSSGAAGAAGQAGSAGADGKPMTKQENRIANQKQDMEAMKAKGDARGAEKLQNQMRREGKGKDTDGGFGAALLGKNSSGTINGKASLDGAFLGKNSSGSMNGKTDLNAAAAGMTDTRASNKADNDQYMARRKADNARMASQNSKAASAMGPNFNRSGKGGKTTMGSGVGMAEQNKMAEFAVGENFHKSGEGGTGLNESKQSRAANAAYQARNRAQ